MSPSSPPRQAPETCARLLVFVPPRHEWSGGKGHFAANQTLDYLRIWGNRAPDYGSTTLANLPPARVITAVLDDRDVMSRRLQAPKLNDAKLRLALPNLLEEYLLTDPSDCHFAWQVRPPAAGEAGLSLTVCAIDRSTLSRVVDVFEQAGRTLHQAVARQFTLPEPQEGIFAAYLDAQRCLIRLRGDGALSVPRASVGAVLAMLKNKDELSGLNLFQSDPISSPSELFASANVDITCSGSGVDVLMLDNGVNLLQGSFAPRQSLGRFGRALSTAQTTGSWRAPVGWLLAALLITVVGLNTYWWKLAQINQSLRASAHQTFRDAFPGEPAIDELAQAQQAVSRLRQRAGRISSDDFSALNGRASSLLSVMPVGSVSSLDYADRRLRVQFSGPQLLSPAAQNALRARAPSLGLRVLFDTNRSAVIEALADASSLSLQTP